MPFKSKSQRGFMYANHPKLAKEFEAATPEGKSLPEHVKHMAEGGEVKAPEGDEFTEGVKSGVNADLDSLKNFVNHIHEKYVTSQGDTGTLKGFENLTKQQTKPNMAGGGDISYALSQIVSPFKAVGNTIMEHNPLNTIAQGMAVGNMNNQLNPQGLPPTPPPDTNFQNQLQQGTTGITDEATPQPSAPPLSQTMQNLNKTPDTNYDFYKDIGADDRMKLYQTLSQQQRGPQALIAQGLGGLGDAISNSFGGKSNTFQKDVMATQEAKKQGALGAMDTQRQQKLQDMQANTAAQANDPNSPLSKAVRDLAEKAMGKKMPSMMPASMLEKLIPGIGELAMKQLATMEMSQFHKASVGEQAAERGRKEEQSRVEHPILHAFDRMSGGTPESALPNAANPYSHGIPDVGQTFNGGKILKVTKKG